VWTVKVDSDLCYSASASQHAIVTGPTGKQAAGKADEPAGETVVLLADADLLELPLEAVAALRAEVVDSVSRDISLQLLYHRLTTTPSGDCHTNHFALILSISSVSSTASLGNGVLKMTTVLYIAEKLDQSINRVKCACCASVFYVSQKHLIFH